MSVDAPPSPALLAIAPIHAPALAALAHEYTVHRRWPGCGAATADPSTLRRVRGLVTTGVRGFRADDLHDLPALEIIACFGQSHGTLDLAAAQARSIVVTNTPDWTEEAVADVALGLLLGTLRRLCEADRFVREGRWEAGPFALSTDLRGKTCGIVGMGAIGRAVARRAAAFGLRIEWHGPRDKPDAPGTYVPRLLDLATRADCLVVACASTAQTRGMIDARVLEALGPSGYLVNVSRGAVVDEPALIDALARGRIAGAGLEVFADEPRVPAALRAMEQVMLVPHLGSSTREIRAHRQACWLESLRAHFAGEPVPHRVHG
jgi:lactate dehydrogenase-like 2-hydroxyacid dehydrogenase